jgi:DNA-binding CsgD family transcriptional regulator
MELKGADLRQQFIHFGGSGEIKCLSQPARRLLKKYFPRERNPARLPGTILQWIKINRARTKHTSRKFCQPLIFGSGKKYLLIQFPDHNCAHDLLLLSEGLVAETPAPRSALTRREREVLSWIAKSKSNPEIGIILDVSPRTVEKHVERILDKLGVESRAAAMADFLESNAVRGGGKLASRRPRRTLEPSSQ